MNMTYHLHFAGVFFFLFSNKAFHIYFDDVISIVSFNELLYQWHEADLKCKVKVVLSPLHLTVQISAAVSLSAAHTAFLLDATDGCSWPIAHRIPQRDPALPHFAASAL